MVTVVPCRTVPARTVDQCSWPTSAAIGVIEPAVAMLDSLSSSGENGSVSWTELDAPPATFSPNTGLFTLPVMYPAGSNSSTLTVCVDGTLSIFRMTSPEYSAHRKISLPLAAIDAAAYAIRFAVGTPAGFEYPFGAVAAYVNCTA